MLIFCCQIYVKCSLKSQDNSTQALTPELNANYYSFIANQLTEKEQFVMHISFPCIVPFKLCPVLLFPLHSSILTLCNVSNIS